MRMKSPVKDIEDYIKQEDYHSFVLQGLVHNYYIILDVFVEWLGKSIREEIKNFMKSNLL